jgi:RNA polymerase sigma-B factor
LADDDRREGRPLHGASAYPRSEHRDRDQLATRHLSLARHLALRYSDGSEPLEDLVQVASLGLLKAAERFDPERGVAFSTFAVPTILGELRRHFRDRGWMIHVPRDLKEASLRVSRALAEHSGRSTTPAQLAELTGLPLETVIEALDARGARYALSLDAPTGTEEDDAGTLMDQLGSPDRELARARARVTLDRLGRGLDERDREILRLRFEEDLTQSEIGERIGVSQMQVSRLLRAALERMRRVAGIVEEDDAA